MVVGVIFNGADPTIGVHRQLLCSNRKKAVMRSNTGGNVMDWWQKGFEGFIEWNAMLGKVCGLQPTPSGSWDKNKVWEETLQNFQRFFQDYFKLFGYVLRTDYDRLKNEYDRLQEDHQLLKRKSEIQEETIRNLQAMLAAQTMDPAGLAQPMKELIAEQTGQFRRLMSGMIPNVKKPSTED